MTASLLSSGCSQTSIWSVTSEEFIENAPAVPEVTASTLVETRSGMLIAAWAGGIIEGHKSTSIWVSRNDGTGWTSGQIVADGAGADRLPCWNPVLSSTTDGRLLLYFKVGPSSGEQWIECLISDDEGLTWKERSRLTDNFTGRSKKKSLLIDAKKQHSLVASTGTSESESQLDVNIVEENSSHPSILAATTVPNPASFHAQSPSIIRISPDRLVLLTSTADGQLASSTSTDNGKTWNSLNLVGIELSDSGIDAISLKQGGALLVCSLNDSSAPFDNKLKTGGCPLVVFSSQNGLDWTPILTLEQKATRYGYDSPSIIQTDDGKVHITYTWNRWRIKHVVLDKN